MQAVGADFDVLTKIEAATRGRILFSYGTGPDDNSGREQVARLEKLCEGRDITAISQPRGSGFMFGMQSNLPPVKGPTWSKIRKLDLAGRVAAISDPETARSLVEEAKQEGATPVNMAQVFYLGTGESPNYTAPMDQNLAAIADAAEEHWSETFLRLSRESKGKGLFNLRMFNQNLKALGDLFKSEHCFPSLGDAGAHVSQIMDAGWTSFVLSYWTREIGLYTLGEAVRRLTSGPARVLDLKDRGVLKAGMRADVNVFDADRVAECQPELVHDFPGGAPRYIQRSVGYKTTILNGQVNVVDGEHTGARAGKVLRHGQ